MVLQLVFVVDVPSALVIVDVARKRLGLLRPAGPVARNLLIGTLVLCSTIALLCLASLAVLLDGPPISGRVLSLSWLMLPVGFVALVVVPIIPLIAFRVSAQLVLLRDVAELRRLARTVKLVGLPYAAQNMVLGAVLVLGLTLFPLIASRGTIIFMGPFALPVIGAFSGAGCLAALPVTYLPMLPTSIHGIALLIAQRRDQTISTGQLVLHTVLHLVPVAAFVSALVITRRGGPEGVSGRATLTG